MRRALVTVATEPWHILQDRQIQWFWEVDQKCMIRAWREIPAEWPSHSEKPYAFKSRALLEASRTCCGPACPDCIPGKLLLWCDSAIVPVRDMTPLWQRIERDGYWVMNNGWNNYEWTADSAYPALFPGLSLTDAREINKTTPHVCAAAFGLSTAHPVGRRILDLYFELCNTMAICGPWKNTPETPCGPSDVLGHRHDQTILSVIAYRLNLKLTNCPDVFSYAPGSQESILVSDGAMALKAPHVFAER